MAAPWGRRGAKSDEDLAAAWGAETDDVSEANQSARVLNQAEIDNLLGF